MILPNSNCQQVTDQHRYAQFGTDPFKIHWHIKQKGRLTTIIAVRYNEGILLCSDTQATRLHVGIRTTTNKITPINEYCLLGCSGTSNYINIFTDIVRNTIAHDSQNSFEQIDGAIQSYVRYVAERQQRTGIDHSEEASIEGIFTLRDPENIFHIYEFATPHAPLEQPTYSTAGSGGVYAGHLFTIADKILSHLEYTWNQLSVRMVSQFCYLLLGRIINYDLYSGFSTAFYQLDGDGHKRLWDDDIFPPTSQPRRGYRISRFIQTLFDELPDRQIQLLRESYFDEELLRAIMRRLGFSP